MRRRGSILACGRLSGYCWPCGAAKSILLSAHTPSVSTTATSGLALSLSEMKTTSLSLFMNLLTFLFFSAVVVQADPASLPFTDCFSGDGVRKLTVSTVYGQVVRGIDGQSKTGLNLTIFGENPQEIVGSSSSSLCELHHVSEPGLSSCSRLDNLSVVVTSDSLHRDDRPDIGCVLERNLVL